MVQKCDYRYLLVTVRRQLANVGANFTHRDLCHVVHTTFMDCNSRVDFACNV